MEIANIHSMRSSLDSLMELCATGSEDKWLSKLESTGWLRHVRLVLSGVGVYVCECVYVCVCVNVCMCVCVCVYKQKQQLFDASSKQRQA